MKERFDFAGMRRGAFLLLICSLLICCTTVGAQIKTYQLSLKDSSTPELYRAVPNRVRITGLKPGDKVSLGNTSSERVDSNIYTFRIDGHEYDTLLVRRNNKVIFSKVYRVKQFPDPILCLGTVKGGRPTYTAINEILADPGLVTESGNFNHGFVVSSFEMAVQTKDSYEGPMSECGDRLSSYQVDLIKHLCPGDKIYIENIRVIGPDGIIRTLNNLAIQIK